MGECKGDDTMFPFDIARYETDGPVDVILIEQLDDSGGGWQPQRAISVPLDKVPSLIWRLYEALDAQMAGAVRTAIAETKAGADVAKT